jgi:Thioesterase-like superfamily
MQAVFTKSNTGDWLPSELAQGPFAGLQGGAVAGLLVAEIEELVAAEQLGQVVGVSVSFYRPTPLEAVRTSIARVRMGRRASFIENSLRRKDGELCATVRTTVIQEEKLEVPNTLPEEPLVDTSAFVLRKPVQAPHGKPWFMDTMQASVGGDGTTWFKVQVPIIAGAGYFSRALGPADWCHGINRPFKLAVADPNQDLAMHLVRAPRGEWLGIRATTQWQSNGTGLGYGTLCDVFGVVGVVSMSVALVSSNKK